MNFAPPSRSLLPRGASLLAIVLALASCGSRARAPVLSPDPYAGPSIRTDADPRQHRVILEAPSSGWLFTLDQVRKKFGGFDVYVTARKPDPTFNHTQVMVTQYAGTGVEPVVPINVFARVINFGSPGIKEPYRLAATGAPANPPSNPEPAGTSAPTPSGPAK